MRVQKQPEYWVYAIEFDADWTVDKGKGTVYVGYTARTPEQRLEAHRRGGRTSASIFKASRSRRATNLRLRGDLSTAKPGHGGPWPTEKEAMTHERKLANLLKAHGYMVVVGLGKPFGRLTKEPVAELPARRRAPQRASPNGK